MITGNELVHPDIVTEPERDKQYGTTYGNVYSHGGITIRQHFASLFMQGILSASNLRIEMGRPLDKSEASSWCREAVMVADTLIEELNKPKP